jgi:hypothetical protein
VKLLQVVIDRLRRWALPGLVCIGDAAHAMSPVGGVGVNLAVQDAVAAANLLAGPLAAGVPTLAALEAVQRRRAFPARMTQRVQVAVQNLVVLRALDPDAPVRPPLPLRAIDAVPRVQGLTARLIGIGVRPEHVRSPVAGVPSSGSASVRSTGTFSNGAVKSCPLTVPLTEPEATNCPSTIEMFSIVGTTVTLLTFGFASTSCWPKPNKRVTALRIAPNCAFQARPQKE